MKVRSIALASLALMSVIVPALAAAPVAAQTGNQSADGPMPEQSDSNWTVSELSQGGTSYADSPPSARIADNQIYWFVHWPADKPWAEEGEDQQWTYLKPGSKVQRNSIYLRTIRADPGTQERTLNIVYWTQGETVVENGNTTTTVDTVENATHVTKRVSLGQGWPMKEISLRRHDEPVRVTMWFEGAPEDARWTFKHESVATTAPANIQSQGDYLIRVLMEFVAPTVIGLFVIGWVIRRAIRKAGVGPQYGYAPWLFALAVGSGVSMLALYSDIASLLVDLPRVLSVLVVAIAGIVMLETFTSDARKAAFFQPEITNATSPSGDEARDILHGEWQTETIVKKPDGTTLLARPGLLPFLARWAGGGAVLQGAEALDTEIHLDGGDVDELYIVDPTADEPVDYDPEGWTLNLPDPEEEGWPSVLTTMGIFAGGAYALAQVTGPAIAAGAALVVGAWHWVEPTTTSAEVEGTSVHMREAWSTSLFMAQEVENAQTIEREREKRIEAEVQSEKDVEKALENQDATLIQSMHETDVERAIDNIDVPGEPDDEDQEVPADD